MNILKTKVKIITLLLSTVILLASCSQGTENTVNASKITPSPAISTQAPAATEKSATAAPETQPPTVSSETTYIMNTNTKKFHYPSCPSASEIKEKNKREFTGTRDEVIAQKYVPCKRCTP